MRRDRKEYHKEYSKDHYQKIKADPKQYASYLDRKRREAAGRAPFPPGYERERKARWRAAHPDKARRLREANHAIEMAVVRGILVRPSCCEKCGVTCTPEGHHKEYSRAGWLDVNWLCRECHSLTHHPRPPTEENKEIS
jgi:hypothetical protein